MKILFATDGSECANTALEFMLRFPFPRSSTITVMTVVDAIPMSQSELDKLDATQNSALDRANDALREEATQLLEAQSSRLREDGWPGTTIIRSGGEPAEEILLTAKDLDADLIVVGSHGASGLQHFLLGSVSEQVLESASCSVLIVKQPAPWQTSLDIEPGTNTAYRILLAYDNSKAAHNALDLCASLPLEQGSEVRVVGVLPLVTAYRQDIRQHLNSIWQQKKEILQSKLEQAAGVFKSAAVNVETRLLEGTSVSKVILDATETEKSDLIVFGCKDKGVISKFLYGSITHGMARYSTCSVFAVRNKQSTN